MSTEKKVIAKLTVKSSSSRFTLLVFAHDSGIVSYHLRSEISMANQSLDQLTLKSPLPCVKFDYLTVKTLIDAVATAIEAGGCEIVNSTEYFSELA